MQCPNSPFSFHDDDNNDDDDDAMIPVSTCHK